MEISTNGRLLIKVCEDFHGLRAADDGYGNATVGWGCRTSSDRHLSARESELLFESRLSDIQSKLPKIYTLQSLWDAIVSLAFNVGPTAVTNSRFWDAVTSHRNQAAAAEFAGPKGFVNVNGKFDRGLANRRNLELEYWQRSASGWDITTLTHLFIKHNRIANDFNPADYNV